MTVLQVPAGSPDWAFAAADVVLILHIAGGSTAIVSGAVALFSRKGEWIHRVAGTVFFLGMLAAAGVGATVSPFLADGQRTNTLAGVLTFYLVLTAWTTVRRQDGGTDRFAIVGFMIALGAALAAVLFYLEAQASPTQTIDGSPPQALYMFMIVGSFAAATDLKVIVAGGITGAARIARHLWRMCTGLFIASGSFFLGQQQVMPKFMHGSPWLFVPVLLPLVLLLFWMVRVRLTNWASRPPKALASPWSPRGPPTPNARARTRS